MQDFTKLLLSSEICGKRQLELRKGLWCDDVFNKERMIVIITSGQLEVVAPSGAIINILNAGEVYAIASLYLEESLFSRLRARSDVSLILIPRSEVLRLLDEDRTLNHAYCALLNQKLDFLFSRVSLLSIKNNRRRLASYLADEQRPAFSTKDELASFLALGRSALFRELAFLAEQGIISLDNGEIKVIDKEKLLEVIHA